MNKNASTEDVLNNFNNTFDFEDIKDALNNPEFKLMSLKSIYFSDLSPAVFTKTGNHTTPKFLLSVAILIIIIALINYTNLNVALAPVRAKSINIRKVLGCSNLTLRLSIFSEGIILCVISYILAVIIVGGLYTIKVLDILNVDINPLNNIGLFSMFGGIAVIIGIIASIQPAFYTTSLPPAMALRGNLNTRFSGKAVRSLLVGFQFVISVVLITFSIFISKQNAYMQNFSLGYDTHNIVVVEPGQSIMLDRKNEYINKLKSHPKIIDVASTNEKFGSNDVYATWGLKHNSEEIIGYTMPSSWNLLKVLNIAVL